MADDMFLSNDKKSLRRGRRVAARTETCRPCLVQSQSAPELTFHGVVLDITPYGMMVRVMDPIADGTAVVVQLMRDDEFTVPLAEPREGKVVRVQEKPDGFFDLGVQLVREDVRRPESPPIHIPKRRPMRYPKSRMHTIDFIVGGETRRRSEK